MFRDYVCRPDSPESVYVVHPGDSLWRIASRQLGNETLWSEIAALNGLREPYVIFVGQRLYLPPRQVLSVSRASQTPIQAGGQCTPQAVLNPRATTKPALQVEHAPVRLELNQDIPVINLTFPGGECTIGFKGELTMYRKTPLPIAVTRDGLKVEYESSQKAWAADRYLSLFRGVGLSVDRNGALTVIAKAGLETEWYKGTFEINPDGAMKYEVEPKPVKAVYKDVKLEGTIGCWVEAKPNLKFDPTWVLQPSVLLTQRTLMNMLAVVFFTYAAATAATAVSGAAGVSIMSFGQFLNLVAKGLAGTASSFMLILIPPGVMQEINRQSGRPKPSDYSL